MSGIQAQALTEMRERALPSLQLVSASSGRSRVGGLPQLGDAFAWPSRDGRPLSFLAQIDLEEARAADGLVWLPDRGMLFFFYQADDGPWGFSPDDKDSWAVLFDAAPERADLERRPPEPAPMQFPEYPVSFRARQSLPSPERLETDTSALDEADWEVLQAAIDLDGYDPPWHQIGGWPRPVQNDDMEVECQLASNGVDCGGPEGSRSEKAIALRPGATEWRLLLQLDSDDDSEMMWGDSGILYFWIREADARAGDFSKACMILQCC